MIKQNPNDDGRLLVSTYGDAGDYERRPRKPLRHRRFFVFALKVFCGSWSEKIAGLKRKLLEILLTPLVPKIKNRPVLFKPVPGFYEW